jgi:hypothetical protein
MTAILVTASAAKVHMGVTSTGDDTLIQTYVDAVEALLCVQAGRRHRPFATAATGRSEVHAGTGTELLVTDYPITTASGISVLKIGHDVANPSETITATDIDQITAASGSRSIYRTDGGVFGTWGEPRTVHITYDHTADTSNTDVQQLAIKRVVAQVYRQRGSEDAKSETLPNGYQRTLESVADADPIWRLAVEATLEPVFP